MAREYFCAYHDMLDSMKKLSDEQCGRLFRALLEYSATGSTTVELHGREEGVFDVLSVQIERDIAKYEKKCRSQAQNAAKRWEPAPRDDAEAQDGTDTMPTNATACDGINGTPPHTDACQASQTCQEEEKEEEKEEYTPPISPSGGDAPAPSESKPGKSRSKAPEPVKKPYGEFQNVMLTDEEYAKLSGTARGLIEEMSCYIKSGGKGYKSHYAALLNWERRRVKDKGGGGSVRVNDNDSFTSDDLRDIVEEF